MARYRVRGRTVATAATADVAIAGIWNPHATKRIYVLEFACSAATAPGAGAGFHIRRSTARGTQTSTVTPIADHADEADATPHSGWVLDIDWSADPTLAALPSIFGWILAAVAASGIVYPFSGRGVCVKPGTGLVWVNNAAIAVPALEFSVVVDD